MNMLMSLLNMTRVTIPFQELGLEQLQCAGGYSSQEVWEQRCPFCVQHLLCHGLSGHDKFQTGSVCCRTIL